MITPSVWKTRIEAYRVWKVSRMVPDTCVSFYPRKVPTTKNQQTSGKRAVTDLKGLRRCLRSLVIRLVSVFEFWLSFLALFRLANPPYHQMRHSSVYDSLTGLWQSKLKVLNQYDSSALWPLWLFNTDLLFNSSMNICGKLRVKSWEISGWIFWIEGRSSSASR